MLHFLDHEVEFIFPVLADFVLVQSLDQVANQEGNQFILAQQSFVSRDI